MSKYIDVPEAFTNRMSLSKSRYRVERTEQWVTFTREWWDGGKWERSPFSDGITIPACVAEEVAKALTESLKEGTAR